MFVQTLLAEPTIEALDGGVVVAAASLNLLRKLAFTETSFSVGFPGRLKSISTPRS